MSDIEKDLDAVCALITRSIGPLVKEWLKTGTPHHVFGLPLLGLPIGPSPDNCWGATLLLQSLRPDLAKAFLVIRMIESRALCIQPMGAQSRETPLLEINLDGREAPITLPTTFEAYLEQGLADFKRSERVLDEVDDILKRHGYTYDHNNQGKLPRAHQTRIVRSCVHDVVVGIASLRQDAQRDLTEIGLFEATDHPLYRPGHGVRSLAALVLADAYKSGVSLGLQFNEVRRLRSATTPAPFRKMAGELEVALADAPAGRVSHEEGSLLFARLSGLSEHAIQRISIASRRERITIESVSYLIISRCWTLEEAEWILAAAPRPAAVLFGDDNPEDWLSLSEALPYAHAAIMGSTFRASLNENGEEGVDTSHCITRDGLFHLELRRDVLATWGAPQILSAGQRIAVLPRPRYSLGFEGSVLLAEAKKLTGLSDGADERLLVVCADVEESILDPISVQLRDLGVTVVVSTYSVEDLQHIYESRLTRIRRARR